MICVPLKDLKSCFVYLVGVGVIGTPIMLIGYIPLFLLALVIVPMGSAGELEGFERPLASILAFLQLGPLCISLLAGILWPIWALPLWNWFKKRQAEKK